MYAVALILTSATLGVDFGWQPNQQGELEYIIQIEPESLEQLKSGKVISTQLPPEMQKVKCFRVQIGTGEIPRVDLASFEQPLVEQSLANKSASIADQSPTGTPALIETPALTGSSSLVETNSEQAKAMLLDSVESNTTSKFDINQALAVDTPGSPKTSVPNYGAGGSSYFSRTTNPATNLGPSSSAARRYGDAQGNTTTTTPSNRFSAAPSVTAATQTNPTNSTVTTPNWSNGSASTRFSVPNTASGSTSTAPALNQPSNISAGTGPLVSGTIGSTVNQTPGTNPDSSYNRFNATTNPNTASGIYSSINSPQDNRLSNATGSYAQGNATIGNNPGTNSYNTIPYGNSNTVSTVSGTQPVNGNLQNNSVNNGYDPKNSVAPNPTSSQNNNPTSTQMSHVNNSNQNQASNNQGNNNQVPNYQNQNNNNTNNNPNAPNYQQQQNQNPGQNNQPNYPQQNPMMPYMNPNQFVGMNQPGYSAGYPYNPAQMPYLMMQNPQLASLPNGATTAASQAEPKKSESSPNDEVPKKETKADLPVDKPWILFVFLGAISLALNFWLGWMNIDLQSKYRDMIQDMRDLRTITE